MGGMAPNMNSMGGQGPMGGGPSGPGPQPHPQMNGTTASAIHALPTSLPGQSSSSALTQKLAGTQDADMRRTMLGEWVTHIPSLGAFCFLHAFTTAPAVVVTHLACTVAHFVSLFVLALNLDQVALAGQAFPTICCRR